MQKIREILLFVLVGVILILIGIFIFYKNKGTFSIIPVITILPSSTPITTQSGQITYTKVTRVIDGDTIVIDSGSHIRYIGMNTPELETSQCYATEASKINSDLVLGKEVKLVKDVSETDKYGRLLRFVYVGDQMIDDELVKIGAAKIETVSPDIEFKDLFLQSQNYAKENKLGLWGKCN